MIKIDITQIRHRGNSKTNKQGQMKEQTNAVQAGQVQKLIN